MKSKKTFTLVSVVILLILIKPVYASGSKINEENTYDRFVNSNYVVIVDTIKQLVELDGTIEIGEQIDNGLKNYPIFSKKNMIGYITVYKDLFGDFIWSYSELMSESSLSQMKLNPKLKDEYNGIIKILEESHSSKLLKKNKNIEYNYEFFRKVYRDNFISTYLINSETISLRILEKQSSKPWCAAYATATIINTINKSSYLKAYSIIKHFHKEATNIDNLRMTDSQVSQYGRYRGFKTVKTGPLSINIIRQEISKKIPIYIAGNRYSNNVIKGRHAFVIAGYNMGANMLYAWNPWGQYTWFSARTKAIPASSYTYYWDTTVSGWSK